MADLEFMARTYAALRRMNTMDKVFITAINGLAGLVSSDLDSSGYNVIATTSTTPGHSHTVVLYADGQKPAAQKVARNLGVKRVQRLDKQTRDLAGGADVVVIAGEDRA